MNPVQNSTHEKLPVYLIPVSAVLTASTFNWLQQYAINTSNRTYCYTGLAIPSCLLSLATKRWPGWVGLGDKMVCSQTGTHVSTTSLAQHEVEYTGPTAKGCFAVLGCHREDKYLYQWLVTIWQLKQQCSTVSTASPSSSSVHSIDIVLQSVAVTRSACWRCAAIIS